MGITSRDRVDTDLFIEAPTDQVFKALTDPDKFPTWGPERIEGRLEAGQTPVLDFGEHGGGKVMVYVEAFDPPSYFAFRWAQGSTDPEIILDNPLKVPNTLVEFRLEEEGAGTRVRVAESGFSALPGEATDEGLAGPLAGWTLMLASLGRSFNPLQIGDVVEVSVAVAGSPEEVFEALTHPETWWAERVEGAFAEGQQVLMDFGQFGQWRVAVETIEPPRKVAYRRVQGSEETAGDPLAGRNTLVTLWITPVHEGCMVIAVESGFDALGEDQEQWYKRAYQTWSIVLGLLQMRFSKG